MNRYEAVVESCDPRDSHAWVRLGRARLAVRRWPDMKAGQKATIRLRPEDVLLCASHPGPISARNVMPGFVASVKRTPDGVRVRVDAGFPVVALVTRAAVEELRLKAGAPVFVIVKATAVVPEVDVPMKLRATVRTSRGDIDAERVDLLRAIRDTGSLSSAARALDIAYRTAWLWIRDAQRVWGSPLVAGTHGGRGGGGASLTPQGRSLLSELDAFERR